MFITESYSDFSSCAFAFNNIFISYFSNKLGYQGILAIKPSLKGKARKTLFNCRVFGALRNLYNNWISDVSKENRRCSCYGGCSLMAKQMAVASNFVAETIKQIGNRVASRPRQKRVRFPPSTLKSFLNLNLQGGTKNGGF